MRPRLNVAEAKVELICVLRELPETLSERFGALYANHFDQRVFSNFLLLPGSPKVSFCLSALPDDVDCGLRQVDKARQLRALLYVEGHLEPDTGREGLDGIIESAPRHPEGGPMTEFAMWRDEKGAPVVTTASIPLHGTERTHKSNPEELFRVIAAPEDVAVMIAAPRTVGFYAEITPAKDVDARSEQLVPMISQFRENLRRSNSELRFELDFLFDFSRQWQFAPGGALSSAAALDSLRGDQNLERTRQWLRQERPSGPG